MRKETAAGKKIRAHCLLSSGATQHLQGEKHGKENNKRFVATEERGVNGTDKDNEDQREA
jgi:hypothetical protein